MVPLAATPIVARACALASTSILRDADTGGHDISWLRRLNFLLTSSGSRVFDLSMSKSLSPEMADEVISINGKSRLKKPTVYRITDKIEKTSMAINATATL